MLIGPTGYMNVMTLYTYEYIYIFVFADATHHMWSSTRIRLVCRFVSCLPQWHNLYAMRQTYLHLYYSTVTRIYFVLASVYITLPIRSWLNCLCTCNGVLPRVAANTFLGIVIDDSSGLPTCSQGWGVPHPLQILDNAPPIPC